jgi:phosphate starvation-inducible PhoH-like protein
MSHQRRGLLLPGQYPEGVYRKYQEFDIVFAIGPAGTGKTYLAMAMAVSALIKKEVRRIVLARPAVERVKGWGSCPVT